MYKCNAGSVINDDRSHFLAARARVILSDFPNAGSAGEFNASGDSGASFLACL